MSQYKIAILILLQLCGLHSIAQNRVQAQEHINILASDSFSGRGYIDHGDLIAAEYIRTEFKSLGLKPLAKNYFQNFEMNVNSFPFSEIKTSEPLIAGVDYLIAPHSKGLEVESALVHITKDMIESKGLKRTLRSRLEQGGIPVIHPFDHKNNKAVKNYEWIKECSVHDVVILIKPQLTWSMSQTQSLFTEIWIKEGRLESDQEKISISIKAELKENYRTQNVMGYVEGTEYPDSFIILCGHYDHLGKMGDAIFHGANDNASGIAMLLDLASHFSKNPQKYSVAFIAFGGEEVGLLGSYKFVTDPPQGFKLASVKFVFNMDLMGSGEDGATIVNGRVFTSHFEQLTSINEEHNYLKQIKARGKAANSDHYFFSEIGIPSFFIYLMGDYTHYHIPLDNSSELQLGPYYDRCFSLIRDFIVALNVVN